MTENPTFTELELKYLVKATPNLLEEDMGKPTPQISAYSFVRYVLAHTEEIFKKLIVVDGPDTYYSHPDGRVVRHRHDAGGTHIDELTVKMRNSETSVVDRVEVDLKLGEKIKPDDVRAFLATLGFEEEMILMKHAHIIWIEGNGIRGTSGRVPGVTLCIYNVTPIVRNYIDYGKTKYFIEVEIDKEENNLPAAMETLSKWKERLEKWYAGKIEQSDLSLYEIYSGKKYRIVSKDIKL